MAKQDELNPWELLVQEYPEIAKAINQSIGSVMGLTPLDEKTRQLIYIAAQAAINCPLAVKYHTELALKAGATRDEIVGAASIAAAVAGPKGFVRCFPAIVEAYSETDKR